MTQKADVYSFGVMLVALFVGEVHWGDPLPENRDEYVALLHQYAIEGRTPVVPAHVQVWGSLRWVGHRSTSLDVLGLAKVVIFSNAIVCFFPAAAVGIVAGEDLHGSRPRVQAVVSDAGCVDGSRQSAVAHGAAVVVVAATASECPGVVQAAAG